MKSLRRLTASVVAMLVFAAIPTTGTGAAPTGFVAGSLTMPRGEHVSVSVHVDAAENVRGSLVFSSGPGRTIFVDVTCAYWSLDGTRAVVGGTTVRSTGAPSEDPGWSFIFADGGPGASDQVMYEPGMECSVAPPFLFTAVRGNVVVRGPVS